MNSNKWLPYHSILSHLLYTPPVLSFLLNILISSTLFSDLLVSCFVGGSTLELVNLHRYLGLLRTLSNQTLSFLDYFLKRILIWSSPFGLRSGLVNKYYKFLSYRYFSKSSKLIQIDSLTIHVWYPYESTFFYTSLAKILSLVVLNYCDCQIIKVVYNIPLRLFWCFCEIFSSPHFEHGYCSNTVEILTLFYFFYGPVLWQLNISST